jgi:hypothetical protein
MVAKLVLTLQALLHSSPFREVDLPISCGHIFNKRR